MYSLYNHNTATATTPPTHTSMSDIRHFFFAAKAPKSLTKSGKLLHTVSSDPAIGGSGGRVQLAPTAARAAHAEGGWAGSSVPPRAHAPASATAASPASTPHHQGIASTFTHRKGADRVARGEADGGEGKGGEEEKPLTIDDALVGQRVEVYWPVDSK